jgi:hypothetical protein
MHAFWRCYNTGGDMKVEEAKYSIGELVDWYRRRELVVNKEYQRGGGLWPSPAKSYFIDTILKDFPFPKVYFHELFDKAAKKPRREIVDGQQRLSTIVEFADDLFALGKNARGLEGKLFSQLSEDEQDAFFAYTVAVDVIRNADRAEILQMFRRMNAFTLPLNPPEKRHSEFFGEFKDWVNTVLDLFGSIFIDWNVLTSRQIVRMADAEFIADVALAIEEGIVSTSPAKLLKLYKKYDQTFPVRAALDERLRAVFGTLLAELSEVQGSYITKPHIFHSLICALLHNKFGLMNAEDLTGIKPTGKFFGNREIAITSMLRLAAAHEERDLTEFREYVEAASEGGNRASQRAVRVKWLCKALQGKLTK